MLAKNLGKEYGMDGFGPLADIEGGSSMKAVRVVQKGTQKNDDGTLIFKSDYELLFRMRKSAKGWMARSRDANLRAFNTFKDAWNSTKKERQDAPLYLVNTSYFNVDRNKIGDNLEIIERILNSKGVESLRSAVTGEVVKINYSELFANPPFDLKHFLPTDFDRRANLSRTVASTDGKTKVQVNYRNYGFGEPTKWRVEEYKKYFPSVQNSDDIPRTMRVLSHATGGWLKFPN